MLINLLSFNNIFKFIFCLCCLFLISCEKSNYLAPVVMKGQSLNYGNEEEKSKTIIVKEGYTLYSIARSEGVSVRSIIEANNLKPPFIINKGDKLIVPSAFVYVVKKGDSLWNIAECYGVDITSIINTNNIYNKKIEVGKKLFIPARKIPKNRECNKGINVAKKSIN